jgi:hypothetical protein
MSTHAGGKGSAARKQRDTAETHTLEFVTQALTARYGEGVLIQRDDKIALVPPRLSTGLASLDALTGCGGVPLGLTTLFSGATTSGKLSVAHQVLASAQGPGARKAAVAVLDLTHATDIEALHAAGVDVSSVLFVRPPKAEKAATLLYDLLRAQKFSAFFVDGISDLLSSAKVAREFDAAMPELARVVRQQRTAFLLVDEPAPPWLRWTRVGSAALPHYAALHLAFQRTAWINDGQGRLKAYTTEARVERSRWARSGAAVSLRVDVASGRMEAV